MNTNVKMKIALTKEQSAKLRRAAKNGKPATIRLSNDQLFNESGVDVELSEEQYKKALSASRSKAKRGVQLTFSQEQIGGFIGAILGTIARVAARAAPAAAKAAAVAARTAAKVAPKVASTVSKVAPQILKAAPAAGKALAQGALIAAGGEAVSAIANKIASDKMNAQAQAQETMESSQAQPAQEGNGLIPLGGRGLVPLGNKRGRGMVPLGAQRGRALMTYPLKKVPKKKAPKKMK